MARTKKQEKQTENHAEQNARGWGETITSLVAALGIDYDKLQELRDTDQGDLTDDEREELQELTESATVDGEEFKNQEDVAQRIQESPLSVQVRSGWTNPGEPMEAEDFEILLSTGGPALRIMGELDEHKQPRRAWLEHQDWGTPWTEYHGEHAPAQDDLVTFAQQFFFGE